MRPSKKQILGTWSSIPPLLHRNPANAKLSNDYCYFYQNVDHMMVFQENHYCLSSGTPESVSGKQTNECLSRTEEPSGSMTGNIVSLLLQFLVHCLKFCLRHFCHTAFSASSPPQWKNAEVVCNSVYARPQLSFPKLLRELLVSISSSKRWNSSD